MDAAFTHPQPYTHVLSLSSTPTPTHSLSNSLTHLYTRTHTHTNRVVSYRVWQFRHGANLASRVVGLHDLDLDTEHTLTQLNVAHGSVDVFPGGVARGDEEAVAELHALGTLGAQLARDDDLAAHGAAVHHETQNTIDGTGGQKKWEEAGRSNEQKGNDACQRGRTNMHRG